MLSFLIQKSEQVFRKIPESLILLLARFALAAVFWTSGQTKIDGFALDPFMGVFHLGWPHIKDSTFFLFQNEYNLPLIPYAVAAVMATLAEHILSVLLLIGLFSRLAAFGIACMTLVIQTFVYPDAYPTHSTWLALALLIMYRGAGVLSLDYWFTKR